MELMRTMPTRAWIELDGQIFLDPFVGGTFLDERVL